VAVGVFGGEGSGEGQFLGPSGVAVNSSASLADPHAGEVYVVDKGNARVERFDATGETVLGEFAEPPGGFSTPEAIAVDNSGNLLDPSAGDVYVLDAGHSVIDKFDGSGAFLGEISEGLPGVPFGGLDGVAVDAAGKVWVLQASREVDVFNDAVANEYAGAETPPQVLVNPTPGSAFSVDSADNMYAVRGNLLVAKLNENGEIQTPDISATVQNHGGERIAATITVDLSDDRIYAVSLDGVHVYATTGTVSSDIDSFGTGVIEGFEGTGIAVNSSTGAVYATDPVTNSVHVFAAVTLPDVITGEATNLATEGHATLNGTVNPQGVEVESCEFEYGTETSYGLTAPCATLPAGTGTNPIPVDADVTGLTPGTLYHFRVVATNADGRTVGADRTFDAIAPPKIDDVSASNVTADSATLVTQINPGAADTTYHFDYGTTVAYGSSVPLTDAHTGASVKDVAGSAVAQGLRPSTLYHFRVVAANVLGQVAGEDRTFVTSSTEPTPVLPDGRAWELVSPPAKEGATIESLTAEGGAIQASEDGTRLAYVANAPTGSAPQGNPASTLTEVLATRGAGGWSSLDIATSHNAASGIEAGSPSEYRMFSPDLSLGLVEPIGVDSTPLAPGATEKTIYVRDNATGNYDPVVTGENVPPGTHFGGHLNLAGATPDLHHLVIDSSVPLTEAPVLGGGSLYEVSEGQVGLVSLLPNGEQASAPSLGLADRDVRNAISQDGSRVFWSTEKHLFMRDVNSSTTIQLDANQGGPAPGPALRPATFQLANVDGSRVFFTDAEALTKDSTADPSAPTADLYVYDVATQKLTDLTIDSHAGESADVQGAVIGANEDGTQVYLVARGVLSEASNAENEKAAAGAQNLYMVRNDGTTWEAPKFIATLSQGDGPDWGLAAGGGNLGLMTARVSPNGRYLAFMSSRPLTDYDNIDNRSGQRDQEVFLYDTNADKLTCVSCNSSGARPHGIFDAGLFPGLLVDRRELWAGQWLAGSIPAWTSVDLTQAIYQSRYLSNDGRLFFMSPDSLTPHDINGAEDVYEYEPNGQGGCVRESGCVSLLSSGESPQESAFLDASVSGDDVFFVTAARLAPQDFDESFDVYDARVCSDVSPCLSSSPAGSPPCETPESCKSAPSAPFTFGASATSSVAGEGNLTAAPPATTTAPTRAQALAKALKQCRKMKQKRKRAVCESRARRKYGVQRAAAGRKRHRKHHTRGESS
jgi:hypothetical protein